MSTNPHCTYKRELALERVLSALQDKGLSPTWANIGRELGITRQAAYSRFKDSHKHLTPGRQLALTLQSADVSNLTCSEIRETYAPHIPAGTIYGILKVKAIPYASQQQLLDELLTNLDGADTSHLTAEEVAQQFKPDGMSTSTALHYIHSTAFRAEHGITYKRRRSVKTTSKQKIAPKGEAFLKAVKGIDLSGMTATDIVNRFLPESMTAGYLRQLLCNPEYRAKHNITINIKTRRTK